MKNYKRWLLSVGILLTAWTTDAVEYTWKAGSSQSTAFNWQDTANWTTTAESVTTDGEFTLPTLASGVTDLTLSGMALSAGGKITGGTDRQSSFYFVGNSTITGGEISLVGKRLIFGTVGNDPATVNVTGGTLQWRSGNGTLRIGTYWPGASTAGQGKTTVNLSGGAKWTATRGLIGHNRGTGVNSGVLNVSGAGTEIVFQQNASATDVALAVGDNYGTAQGELNISDAGKVVVEQTLRVGCTAAGTIQISSGGVLKVNGTLQNDARGTITLKDGTLKANSVVTNSGKFEFQDGTLDVNTWTGDLTNLGGTLEIPTTFTGNYTQEDGRLYYSFTDTESPVFSASGGILLEDGEIYLNFADGLEIQDSYTLFEGTFSLMEDILVQSNRMGTWNLNRATGMVVYAPPEPSVEVPEPATWGMLVLGCLGWLVQRCRILGKEKNV